MFNRKTLFVVGAGASHDFGLPVGRNLAEVIASRTKVVLDRFGRIGPGTVDDELALCFFERSDPKINEYANAFRLISNGILLANSIDDFLNIHEASEEIVTVGKAAIIRSILNAERQSKLFVDPSNVYNTLDVRNIRDSWLVKFMQVLGPGNKAADPERVLDNVSFIVFNYDRCLEHFLINSLQLVFGMQKQQATDIVARANIIHPYGSVGPLDKVAFGGNQIRQNFRELSKAIKTYTERVEEESTIDSMHNALEEAQCVVFLGFAYHRQNMAFLKPRPSQETKQIYGTALNMSDSDVGVVVDELSAFFPDIEARELQKFGHVHSTNAAHDNIRIENKLDCSALFDYYAKSLAG
ncbi:hypothetical protein [Bradyrhizobium algeriense]|uniref:hypothetical protein n=1 Tax=Bradyrhizobium algeriense TaxID=634784 RepID=UPI000D389C6C|nr:hypothetical protein [Bradyrhizobium algeriense]